MTRYYLMKILLVFMAISCQAWAVWADDFKTNKQKGIHHYYQKKYAAAILNFGNAEKINQNDMELIDFYTESLAKEMLAGVQLERVKKLIKKQMYGHAESLLDEAEKISPFHIEIEPLRNLISAGKLNKENPLAKLSILEAEKYNNFIALAERNEAENKFEKSLDFYSKALAIVPTDPAALAGYNAINERLKNKEKNEKITALLLEAEKAEAAQNYRPAIAFYNEVLTLDSGNPKAKSKISALEELIRRQQEEADLRRSAQQFLDSGNSALANKKFEDAEEAYINGKNTLAKFADWDGLIKKSKEAEIEDIRQKNAERYRELEKELEDGLRFAAAERFDKAVASFEKVIDLSKKLKIEPLEKQARENLEKAKENMRRAQDEAINEESPYFQMVQSLMVLGIQQFERGNYDRSRKYFSGILELFPKNRVAMEYFTVCNIKINPERKDAILQVLIKDIENNMRTDMREALRIAEVSLKIDNKNEIIKKYVTELREKLKPKEENNENRANAEGLFNRANQLAANNPQQALVLVNQCIAADPTFYRCVILRSKIETRSNVSTGPVVQDVPQAALQAYLTGNRLFQRGDLAGAQAQFQRAVALFPGYIKARQNLDKVNRYLRR